MTNGLSLWAGSALSYQHYVEALAKMEASAGYKAGSNYDQEVQDQMVQVDGNVAVVSVAGSLVDGSAGYGIFYGYTGYNDIRNALAISVSNPDVGAILLNVGSGGGAVSGCHETSQLIDRVNKIKPVVTYTGSAMCSAALWLGSQAEYSFAAETAVVGSLGIIMVHMDRTEQLKMNGMKATIIRAGTEKALASPYEPLSDKATAGLTEQAQALYTIFLAQVASGRKMEADVADAKFGQGREFLGKAAKKSGLVDAIGTYEDALIKAQSLSKKKSSTQVVRTKFGATNSSSVQALASTGTVLMADNLGNLEGISMHKKALTEEQLTAMAAGIELPVELTAEEKAAADAAAAELAKVAADEATAALATKPAVEKLIEGQAPIQSEAVTMLQGMLATANAGLMTAQMEAKAATDALAAVTAQANSFTEIARASVRTMGMHFGLTADAATAMSAPEVLVEHARLSGLFKAKYPGGRIAASSTGKPEAAASAPTMSVSEREAAMKLPRAK